MKKVIIPLLILCMLSCMQGCSKFPFSPTVPTSPTASTAQQETTVEPATDPQQEHFQQKPMIAISLQPVVETNTAADGTVLSQYKYQNMALVVPDPEIANKIIVDFLNRIDETASRATEIANAAKSDYTASPEWNPYLCQISFDPKRIDSGVLSLMGSYVCYSGTPHPDTNYLSVNYDLVTGNVLELDDVIQGDAAKNSLTNAVIQVLEQQKDELYLYEDYQTTVTARIQQESSKEVCWYFSESGLCFFFSPYEIAPYSAGLLTAQIPYDKLSGILNDAYFPGEFQGGSGFVEMEKLSEDSLEHFTQISEIVLDDRGEKIMLHTKSAVHHIKIESGQWNTGTNEFQPDQTVFSAYSLTPADAIMVSYAKDAAQCLRLTYTNTGGVNDKYLTFDAQTNEPILSDTP